MTEQHKYRILIVDDERGNVESLSRIFQREGYEVFTAFDGKSGLDQIRQEQVDIVLCDMMMPQMDGLDLLKAVKTIHPHTEVIVVTAYGSIEKAVEAMRMGAYDFVTKPLKRRDIVKTVERALEKVNLVQENKKLRKRLQVLEAAPLIVGQSPALRRTLEIVKQAAPASATVLIQGESGTGKELIAREVHRLSERSDKRFVAVNCAAFPETLLDSELFGYEKGAFTGAAGSKPGRFELASGGTLFLDEVGELPLTVQVKLLRVLQEHEIERLGGTQTTPIDIRLVTATHRNLEEEVKEGRFREDLFYRLDVIQLRVPPLRERPEDIPLLAQHFLDLYAKRNNKPPLTISAEAMELLKNFNWPGNVRQLENIMERSVVLTKGPMLEASGLPDVIHRSKTDGNFFVIPFGTPLEEIERHVINETMRRTQGDKKLTAQLLGIATRTVYRKLEAFQEEKNNKDESNEANSKAENHNESKD